MRTIDLYDSFAALVYVTASEEEAVMRMYSWQEQRIDGDEQLYYIAKEKRFGKRIIAAKQDEMGMTASATLTMKIIQHFHPKYVIMPGIAAGTLEESSNAQMFGDVIVADVVWNYSNGKYVHRDVAEIVFGEIGFNPRPTVTCVDEDLIPLLESAKNCPKNETHVHIGAIASGSTVVAKKSIIDMQVKKQAFDTKGLEMEAYGVVYASNHAIDPKPYPIVAKSVCDFADSRKSDVFQKFAAYTSCEFVKLLVDEILN